MRYRADITAVSLKVPESRIIADQLLQGLDETGWKEALYAQNVLRTRSPETAKRLALLLRGRLELMQAELQTFDEKLRHYADRRISLDLDDGVKVNYGKFGDLLAEVKAVHGKTAEEA